MQSFIGKKIFKLVISSKGLSVSSICRQPYLVTFSYCYKSCLSVVQKRIFPIDVVGFPCVVRNEYRVMISFNSNTTIGADRNFLLPIDRSVRISIVYTRYRLNCKVNLDFKIAESYFFVWSLSLSLITSLETSNKLSFIAVVEISFLNLSRGRVSFPCKSLKIATPC